jgi:hypothetical protein
MSISKAESMSTDTTQLNWTVSKHVLEISFIHVCETQLNWPLNCQLS